MKYLIFVIYCFILSLVFGQIVLANDVPTYLKDGTITVTLKNGTIYTYSTNKFMIVKREMKVVSHEKEVIVIEKRVQKDNIINGLVGFSNTGIKDSFDGRVLRVERYHELDAGAMFQKRIDDDMLFNVLGTVRGNVMFGIGKEF